MAKSKALNAEDLLEQLKGLITPPAVPAKSAKSDNRKVVAALTQAQKALGRAIALLTGDAVQSTSENDEPETVAEIDSEAPYGRKKDGTPKQRAGRSKAA